MTQHECPRCRATLATKNALTFHALQEEHCYPSSFDRIADKIASRIETLQGQVDFLLYAIPPTRGDNEFLAKWHAVIFQHTHYYDTATQAFHEKHGAELKTLSHHVKQASLERLKRFTQRADRDAYHFEDGASKSVHNCTLPSRQVDLRHMIEAEESKYLWASREAART